jgi:hypothetical protein
MRRFVKTLIFRGYFAAVPGKASNFAVNFPLTTGTAEKEHKYQNVKRCDLPATGDS